MADGGLTDDGRDAREHVEVVTDQMCRPIIDALGDDFDELVGILGRWSQRVQAAGGYPAAGPHDLAALTQ